MTNRVTEYRAIMAIQRHADAARASARRMGALLVPRPRREDDAIERIRRHAAAARRGK